MKKSDFLHLINHVRQVTVKNFDDISVRTNSDMGHLMVVFNFKTLHTSIVDDWGRDRDKDWYLGIDESGWIVYTHIIESMAGPTVIKDSNVKQVTDEYVLDYLLSDDCNIKNYFDFMEKCIAIRKKFYKDFKY